MLFMTHVRCTRIIRNRVPCHLLSRAVTSVSYRESETANVNELFRQLRSGDRNALARSITLVESQHPEKRHHAQKLLNLVLKNSREEHGYKPKSFRIGLTGPPGAGKSSFIEILGTFLTSRNHRVAVLAVDPSSSRTGGSLLGDKTRMPELSRDHNAFIRPSPSSGCLGGVTRTTNDSIALCECAGYDIVLVETVGVGQSEFHVSYMVDMFAMIVSPAGGDELQGLKKGIFELVDLVIVNKADGDLIPSARRMQSEYVSALKFVRRRFENWRPSVYCISSKTKEGLESLWEEMVDFRETLSKSQDLYLNRKRQHKKWMWLYIENMLMDTFKKHPKISALVSDMENEVEGGSMTPGEAADILLNKFFGT